MNDYVAPADNEVSSPSLIRFLGKSMFAGNVYYCWFCDAHRRGVPGAAGTHICPRCTKDLSETARLPQRHVPPAAGEPERRPIYALEIGHPIPNSAPAWTGNVASAT
jgi:hypothetical protein